MVPSPTMGKNGIWDHKFIQIMNELFINENTFAQTIQFSWKSKGPKVKITAWLNMVKIQFQNLISNVMHAAGQDFVGLGRLAGRGIPLISDD